jgi:hypothetical protein
MEIAKEKTSTINFEHTHYVVGSQGKKQEKKRKKTNMTGNDCSHELL